ncbi:hypothetical protein GWA97_04565 [Flavobacterium sp. LaA7.5]|nr:hypothetical protein [Flavobacterium salilacus subsp. altitudinum]
MSLNHLYSQDSTNTYKNLNREERLLNQPSYNNDRIKDFKNESPFHGELKPHEVLLDYSVKDSAIKNTVNDNPEDNPYWRQLNGWDEVHHDPEIANSVQNTIIQSSENNYLEVVFIIGAIALVIIAGIFLYKLLK